MKPRCDRIWEIDALREGLFSESEAESNRRHRATCAECRGRFQGDEHLAELGRALPAPAPDAIRVRRVRWQVLRTAAKPARTSRHIRWLLPALALAAAIVAGWFAVRRPALFATAGEKPTIPEAVAPYALTARVEPSDGARWSQQRMAGTERIRLEEGTIRVAVRHQAAGERCLVELPDGEIEIRGTRFVVTVGDGRTREVTVTHGVVALRLRGSLDRILLAGDSWVGPVETPPTESAQPAPAAPPPAPVARPAAVSRPPVVARGSREEEYVRAMALYRAKRYDAAAIAFHAFAATYPDASEADDAPFLEASALAYAGRPDAAALVAERFLEGHARAFHSRDAAILVARAARARGDCERGRAVLAPWTASPPSPDITAALGSCAASP